MTENQLQFKFCIINKKFYKYIKQRKKFDMLTKDLTQKKDIQVHKNSLLELFDNKRKSRKVINLASYKLI